MTSKNFTIDNVNPLIQYSPPGAWGEGTAPHDLQAHFYSNSTFTVCNTIGSSATFTFNGTKVYVFGGKRMNHGKYSITIDRTQSKAFDGFANPEIIPAPLWVSDTLRLGQHTVTVTNEWTDPNKPDLDIDSITWTASVSNVEPMSLEDTAGAFSYSPPTSWTTSLPESFPHILL
ncbi:hypothetical protein C8J57DRAFT_1090322 [Mycena rebaudengoi]|nr:hypothetical protein C8J57DRAFT_1090322 [Mycena rebaudengoi]